MITRQADRDKPIYPDTSHVLNLRPYTMRAGFDPPKNLRSICGRESVTGTGLVPRISNSAANVF